MPSGPLGDNIAATPGRLVFRNEVLELIQYGPQTITVDSYLVAGIADRITPWENYCRSTQLFGGTTVSYWARCRHRLSRSQRCRQVDDDADDPRPGPGELSAVDAARVKW